MLYLCALSFVEESKTGGKRFLNSLIAWTEESRDQKCSSAAVEEWRASKYLTKASFEIEGRAFSVRWNCSAIFLAELLFRGSSRRVMNFDFVYLACERRSKYFRPPACQRLEMVDRNEGTYLQGLVFDQSDPLVRCRRVSGGTYASGVGPSSFPLNFADRLPRVLSADGGACAAASSSA